MDVGILRKTKPEPETKPEPKPVSPEERKKMLPNEIKDLENKIKKESNFEYIYPPLRLAKGENSDDDNEGKGGFDLFNYKYIKNDKNLYHYKCYDDYINSQSASIGDIVNEKENLTEEQQNNRSSNIGNGDNIYIPYYTGDVYGGDWDIYNTELQKINVDLAVHILLHTILWCVHVVDAIGYDHEMKYDFLIELLTDIFELSNVIASDDVSKLPNEINLEWINTNCNTLQQLETVMNSSMWRDDKLAIELKQAIIIKTFTLLSKKEEDGGAFRIKLDKDEIPPEFNNANKVKGMFNGVSTVIYTKNNGLEKLRNSFGNALSKIYGRNEIVKTGILLSDNDGFDPSDPNFVSTNTGVSSSIFSNDAVRKKVKLEWLQPIDISNSEFGFIVKKV